MKMRSYFIDFENCYGISKFQETFDFETNVSLSDGKQKKAYLIYAPNGSMKTSFSNTFQDIKNGEETRDCFYPNRITKRIVKRNDAMGEDIDPQEILVVETYIEDYAAKDVQILLANKKLKKKYESLINTIGANFVHLSKQLEGYFHIKNIEQVFEDSFGSNMTYYDRLENIYDRFFSADNEIQDYSDIVYSDIVNSDAEAIFTDKEIVKLLKEYCDEYNCLISNSKIFTAKYNHTNAENTLKNLEKEGFFEANHKILLSGEEEGIDGNAFREKLQKERDDLIDENMKATFDKIDKILSKKIGTRNLREFLVSHKYLLVELHNYEEFKRKLIISYLRQCEPLFKISIRQYKEIKGELNELIQKAKEEKSQWERVVDEFNNRFNNMPFKLKIENKEDVVLKNNIAPSLGFIYSDYGADVEVSERDLKMHLSNGEKKALYLLNMLFEIEIRREQAIPTLIIMDDIADSFDYRNKYAIVEYIKDIIDDELFYPIILTHNFDFYRTLGLRLELRNTAFFAMRNDGEITLKQGKYFSEILSRWKKETGSFTVYNTPKIFISAIPFVRNLIEYFSDNYKSDKGYQLLTSLLHYKKDTNNITVADVIKEYQKYLSFKLEHSIMDKNKRILDLIDEEATKIMQDIAADPIEISNKIVLSMAIRLKAEDYMIKHVKINIDDISENQTRNLLDAMSFGDNDKDRKIHRVLDRVLLITSSNIHINSFMYEPIVDISLEELKKLYNEVAMLEKETPYNELEVK